MEHSIIVTIQFPAIHLNPLSVNITKKDYEKEYSNKFPKDYIVIVVPHYLEKEKVLIDVYNTKNSYLDNTSVKSLNDIYIHLKNMSTSIRSLNKFKL